MKNVQYLYQENTTVLVLADAKINIEVARFHGLLNEESVQIKAEALGYSLVSW